MDRKWLLQAGVWALLAVLLLTYTISASTAPPHPAGQAPATHTTLSIEKAAQQIVPRVWLPIGEPQRACAAREWYAVDQ